MPALHAPCAFEPSALDVILHRRRERDATKDDITFAGYDICWPDGRPVSLGLRRFCQQGTRLLLGRARDPERALVRVTLYPVNGLDASLTKPGKGIRCRRFYALRIQDEIRFHFFTGAETEIVFDGRQDDPEVLNWLHVEHIRPSIPFWFDLSSQLIVEPA
jgi:hypothetical protein